MIRKATQTTELYEQGAQAPVAPARLSENQELSTALSLRQLLSRLSLGQRLFFVAAFSLSILLTSFYLIASQLYSLSLESLIEERLRLHTFALLRDAENINGEIQLPKYLNETRFNQAKGSLLAFVKNEKGLVQWQSQSALYSQFILPEPDVGEWFFSRAQNSQGQKFFAISYSALWPDEFDNLSRFNFTILERSDAMDDELAQGKQTIALSLFVFAIALLLMQLLVLKLGLRPLQNLTQDINELNQGKRERLGAHYSKELEPISQDINALIDNERRQRQRYQDRMADLSQSLKTPLSVLRTMESDTLEDGQPLPLEHVLDSVKRQSERMNNIIQHQLQRAVTGHASASFVAIPLAEMVQPILDALSKVYHDKNMQLSCDISNDINIYADENDALEIMGNLVDNAFKYGHSRINISAFIDSKMKPSREANRNSGLVIEVEDDGPGIAQEKAKEILKRGVRLDTSIEGQGFGLAMVTEILDSYQAEINLSQSNLGGVLIRLQF